MKKKTENKKEKWIEIIPYGIVGGVIPEASTMLFKQKDGDGRFVVWFSELQSRIAIDQSLNKEKIFDFVQKILKANNSLPKSCFFVKTEKGRDIVELSFNNNSKSLQFFSDEVVCFCMMNNCRFFCTQQFLSQSNREIPHRFRKKALVDKPLYLN